jgi:phage terminase small subunit
MSVLKNTRHERFAQLLASGKNATDAYELAGYKRSHSNGPALARTEEISARVSQITAEALERERVTAAAAAERAVVTRQGLIEAEAARVKAMEARQFSAAIERSERGAPGEFEWIENASAEELGAYIAGKLDIADISSVKH